MDVVNLREKFRRIDRPYVPHIAAELNGQVVKLVRFHGPFDWHHHEEEDEMFLVVSGSFRMEFRERSVEVRRGEFIVVPRGVEHRPCADEEARVLLFEPVSTRNTGDAQTPKSLDRLPRI
jgi:mannose-6-phosphate isomerase-like protein (cupin superfamily)